jgi:putative transposase
MPLLTNDLWRAELSRCIDNANLELQFELIALVYMPEHVHLLVFPLTDNPDLGRYLSLIKRPVSQFVHKHLDSLGSPLVRKLTVPERPGKYSFRFWQEGPGFDRNLYSPKAIEASMNYIHRNPVQRGLCQKATDWKWSTACYYLSNPGQQQFDQLPKIHGVRPEFFERDARE